MDQQFASVILENRYFGLPEPEKDSILRRVRTVIAYDLAHADRSRSRDQAYFGGVTMISGSVNHASADASRRTRSTSTRRQGGRRMLTD